MRVLSEYFDDENIKRATVSVDDDVFYATLYFKEEVISVKPFSCEQNAEHCAEDWVGVNE